MVVSSYLSLKLAKHIEKNEKDKKKKGKWTFKNPQFHWCQTSCNIVKSPLSSDGKADVLSVSPSLERIQFMAYLATLTSVWDKGDKGKGKLACIS